MHLSREAAQEMIEVLRYFVNEGTLGQYSPFDFGVGSWVRGTGKANFDVHGRVVEVRVGETIVIQDQGCPGEAGRHICLWEEAHKLWEPDSPPPEGRTIYEHLEDD
jgi:hypothetical protein